MLFLKQPNDALLFCRFILTCIPLVGKLSGNVIFREKILWNSMRMIHHKRIRVVNIFCIIFWWRCHYNVFVWIFIHFSDRFIVPSWRTTTTRSQHMLIILFELFGFCLCFISLEFKLTTCVIRKYGWQNGCSNGVHKNNNQNSRQSPTE